MKAANMGEYRAIMNLRWTDKHEIRKEDKALCQLLFPHQLFFGICGKKHNPPSVKLIGCNGCVNVHIIAIVNVKKMIGKLANHSIKRCVNKFA